MNLYMQSTQPVNYNKGNSAWISDQRQQRDCSKPYWYLDTGWKQTKWITCYALQTVIPCFSNNSFFTHLNFNYSCQFIKMLLHLAHTTEIHRINMRGRNTLNLFVCVLSIGFTSSKHHLCAQHESLHHSLWFTISHSVFCTLKHFLSI